MSTELDQAREEMLQVAMDELSKLRQEALALPDQSEIESVFEIIDFYESMLVKMTDYVQLIEWTGRSIADVSHELAGIQFGWDSPEAEKVFDEQDRELTKHLRWIDQQVSRNRKAQAGNQTVLP